MKEFAFSDIRNIVSASTGLDIEIVEEVLEDFFRHTAKALADGRRVDYSSKGFGVLRLEARAADEGHVPVPNGEGGYDLQPWSRPECDEVVFRPSPGFTGVIRELTGKLCI